MSTPFLSNQQILFTYYHMKAIYDRYQTTIQNRELTQHMMGETEFKVKVILPPAMIAELTNSRHYRMLVTLMETMTPIVELIEDVEPELVKEVKSMIVE